MRSVVVSEEQQVGTAVHSVIPIGESSLTGEFCTGKARDPRPQNVLCFSYALTCLLLLSFSSVWYDVDGCGEIPTAYNVACFSHGSILFYWVFLPVNYYEDDSFLSCTV